MTPEPDVGSPGNASEAIENLIIESAPQQTQQPVSEPQETQDNSSIVESTTTYEIDCASTRPLMAKVPRSLKICKCVTIWSDFVTWIITFAMVLLIDVSAGIYAGLIVVLVLYGIIAVSKNLHLSEG
jgi:hypothetical protein